jgi:hypothetical protein
MTDPNRISGTLVMEERDKVFPDGRVAVLVFGILAMSKEDAEAYCRARPEQSYVQGHAAAGIMRLGIAEGMNLKPADDADDAERAKSMIDYYSRCTVDQLITSPIWRV